MPFKIQRVARGLNELMQIFGGQGPTELEDRVRAHVDVLQFYAINHIDRDAANNAALAEGGGISLTLQRWSLLFCANATIIKTGTMTAAWLAITVNRPGTGVASNIVASGPMGPFGATETGPANLVFFAPYPMLCPPRTTINLGLNILGTDATANCTITAEFGGLG